MDIPKAIEIKGKLDDIIADQIKRVIESIALKNHMPHDLGINF